jgi:hypothetical protein
MKLLSIFIIAMIAIISCGCHYKYDYDMVLKGEGGFADKCCKECKKHKEKK